MASAPAGQFCWVDLAATDAARAIGFYAGLFGWTAAHQAANGGSFIRLEREGHRFASLYQLDRSALDAGVASHWTPYVRVGDVEATCREVIALGGSVAVEPFAVDGVARIALIVDPVGASFGIWQEPAA
jgi:predicted enzyme related to lactoylglutathione lyase